MNGPRTVIVIAKAPVPGRVKTRLCPPCTPDEAATLARAALIDSLEAAAASSATRRVVLLDGEPGSWLDPAWGFEIVAQRDGDLADRLDAGFAEVTAGSPIVLVGMDTPQLRASDIDRAFAHLRTERDAVLGPAADGGFWLVGFTRFRPGAFTGVPMSRSTTGDDQLARLRQMGWSVALTDVLVDVDTIDDARRVADGAPGTRFARVLDAVESVSLGAYR